MEHYYSLGEYLKAEYGYKMYKLSLSCSTTCPTRDGTKGRRGCIFCSASGSGDFAEPVRAGASLDAQLEAAKARVRQKSDADKFIAYFQSFTGTYASSPEELDAMFDTYEKTAARDDIGIISIGTRPDCLGPHIMERLERLTEIKPLWVELGLQTSNEETASFIRRGYTDSTYADAVNKLHGIGINVITHVIIGLPGEAFEDWLATVRFACSCGTDGLKLQLLHVLSGTDLAADYANGKFEVLTIEEYIDAICRLLPYIPQNVVIHRLTGDGPKSILIAPEWSGNKKLVLNTLNRELAERRIRQGSAVTGAEDKFTESD